MKGTLEKAFGYQGDNLNLRIVSRTETPHKAAVLGRDSVQIGLAENGGHVANLKALYRELEASGIEKKPSQFDVERQGGVSWLVFYLVAPDGLCYWFGERQPAA